MMCLGVSGSSESPKEAGPKEEHPPPSFIKNETFIMFYILLLVMVTQVYTFVKDLFNNTLKMGVFIVCKLYINNIDFKFPIINN